MESVNEFLVEVASVVWGPYMLIPLLLGTGVILTVRLRGCSSASCGRPCGWG